MGRYSKIISLNGEWLIEGFDKGEGQPHLAYKPDYMPKNSIKANVPGIVQNALYENGLIDDPYFEKNNEKILWVEEKEWWYFKDFIIDEEVDDNVKYFLVFEGINYYANIWLDGISLGNQEGMFVKKEYDITELLKRKGKHRLTLRVRLLENSIEDRPGGKQKRGVVWSSGVTAPFSYWWNWAPHLVPIGIWKPVYIKKIGNIKLNDIFIKNNIKWRDNDEAESVTLDISFSLNTYFNKEKNLFIKGIIKPLNFNSDEEFKLEKNITLNEKHQKNIKITYTINKPHLWWPNNLGNPDLYTLLLWVEDERGNILDEKEIQFGIREIIYLQNEDAEWVQEISNQSNRLWSIVGKPDSWTFIINKKRVFIKGSNFLPVDSLFRFTEDRYELFLEQAKEAKLNMLRVWGGGIYETETFFNLCDRKGILLWVDFWLSCADYPLIPQDLFLESAENMVKNERNHPSIALWCGGNEYNPDAPENKPLVDKLEHLVKTLDPTRVFHRGSPYKGDRHGGLLKLPSRTSNKYNGDILNGDQRLVLFRSEVAVLRSSPVLDSLKKFISEKNIWPINKDIWEYHHAVILEQKRDVKEYNAKDDIEHWIMSTQLTHAINRQYNLEYARLSKYKTSGILEWSLNGCWPSFHREMIDYYGVPKPVFYFYKRAAKDYLIVADLEKYVYDGNENFIVDIFVVNDTYYPLKNLKVEIKIFDTELNILYQKIIDKVEVNSDSSVKIFTIDWRIPSDYLNKVLFIFLDLKRDNDIKIADNFYWIGISSYNRPEEIISLDGYWEYQINEEIDEYEWKDTSLPSYWMKPQQPPEEGKSVFYRKSVFIPEEWKDIELEVYSAGIEGNDEIYWNGKLIGRTEEEMSVLLRPDELTYTEEIEEKNRRGGMRVKSTEIATDLENKGELHNVRISADPFTTPNLIKRFYKIPRNIIRWGDYNEILIRLYGEYATGISETIFVRKASSDKVKESVIKYYNDGKYFGEIGSLKEIDIEAKIFYKKLILEKEEETVFKIILRNSHKNLGFFVYIKINGIEYSEAGIYFSDNYFFIEGESEKRVYVKIKNNMSGKGEYLINFEIKGWNIKDKRVGNNIKIILK